MRFPTFGSPRVRQLWVPAGTAWLRQRRSEGGASKLNGRKSVKRQQRRPSFSAIWACRLRRAPILRLSREASLQSFGLVLALSAFPDGAPAQEQQGVRPSLTPKGGARGVPSLLHEDLSSASPTSGTLRLAVREANGGTKS